MPAIPEQRTQTQAGVCSQELDPRYIEKRWVRMAEAGHAGLNHGSGGRSAADLWVWPCP